MEEYLEKPPKNIHISFKDAIDAPDDHKHYKIISNKYDNKLDEVKDNSKIPHLKEQKVYDSIKLPEYNKVNKFKRGTINESDFDMLLLGFDEPNSFKFKGIKKLDNAYLYGKPSEKQIMISNYRTEEGVPNKLNQRLKSIETGESIEVIKDAEQKIEFDYNEELKKVINEIAAGNVPPKDENAKKQLKESLEEGIDEVKNKRKENIKNKVYIKKVIDEVKDKREENEEKRKFEQELDKAMKEYEQEDKEEQEEKKKQKLDKVQKLISGKKIANLVMKKIDSDDKKGVEESKGNDSKIKIYDDEMKKLYEMKQEAFKKKSDEKIALQSFILDGYDKLIQDLKKEDPNSRMSDDLKKKLSKALLIIDKSTIGNTKFIKTALIKLENKKHLIELELKEMEKAKKKEEERRPPATSAKINTLDDKKAEEKKEEEKKESEPIETKSKSKK